MPDRRYTSISTTGGTWSTPGSMRRSPTRVSRSGCPRSWQAFRGRMSCSSSIGRGASATGRRPRRLETVFRRSRACAAGSPGHPLATRRRRIADATAAQSQLSLAVWCPKSRRLDRRRLWRTPMTPFRPFALALLAVVTTSGQPPAQQPRTTAATHGNANAVTARELREYLAFIASDETEGRGTPSRGLDATARYIASHLTRWKLRSSVDDGTYFQRMRLTRTRLDSSATRAELNSRRFSFGSDFVVNVFPGTFTGSLVYISHGWVIKSKNIDPYQGLDVTDKIVIVTETGLPPGVTRADLRGPQGDDWEPPQPALRRRGAKAMIMVPSQGALLDFKRRVRDGVEHGITSVEGRVVRPPVPVVRPSIDMFNALFEGELQAGPALFNRAASGDAAPPFPLSPSKRFTLLVGTRSDSLATQNVVGVLEGRDPALKNEYVTISAHYDHLGIGAPVNG